MLATLGQCKHWLSIVGLKPDLIWQELRQYSPMDTTRYELKTLNRQFQLASKNKVAFTNNLTALLDTSYPNIRIGHHRDKARRWLRSANASIGCR